MQTFYGTKKLAAKPITRAEYNELRGWQLPADESGADEGYLVEYLDGGKPNLKGFAGYVSWSPKEQFENAYQPLNALSFGHAKIAAEKEGKKITRASWNGKNQFVYYVPANTYKAQTEAARSVFGEEVPYRAYFALKTVDNDVVPWVPSISDVLANDWMVLGDISLGESVTTVEDTAITVTNTASTADEDFDLI